MMYDTEHTIQKPMPPSHTSTPQQGILAPSIGWKELCLLDTMPDSTPTESGTCPSQASYFKGLFWKQQIYMYGRLVSAAYAMREYKLLMARGGMNQAQTMLSARPCASQTTNHATILYQSICQYQAICKLSSWTTFFAQIVVSGARNLHVIYFFL